MLFADASGNLAQVEVGNFGVAVHQRFSKEEPGIVIAATWRFVVGCLDGVSGLRNNRTQLAGHVFVSLTCSYMICKIWYV